MDIPDDSHIASDFYIVRLILYTIITVTDNIGEPIHQLNHALQIQNALVLQMRFQLS